MTWETQNESAIALARKAEVSRRWYILRVSNGAAGVAKVIDRLPQVGALAFVPTQPVIQKSGKKGRVAKTVQIPIMSGYAVAGFHRPPEWPDIFQLDVINDVLRRDGEPGHIPASDLKNLFGIHKSDVSLLPGSKSLKVGDAIQIIGGPFVGWPSKVGQIKDGECEFTINLFGKEHKVKRPISEVEAA